MVGGIKSEKFGLRRAIQTVARFLLWLVVALALVQPTLAQTDPLARALTLEGEAKRLSEQVRYAEAISKANEALTLWEQALGPNHIIVASSLEWIGVHHIATKDYTAARPLFQRALKIREGIQGPDHPALLGNLDKLAFILSATADYSGARFLYERALSIRERTLGPDHPDLAETLSWLALMLVHTGDYRAAGVLCERRLAILEKAYGPNRLEVTDGLMQLADVRFHLGDYVGAQGLYERALSVREQILGPNHPDVADTLTYMSALFRATGHYAAARPLIERALQIEEQAFGPSDPRIGRSLNYFANLLRETGDYSMAERLLRRALTILEDSSGPSDLQVAYTLGNLGELLRIIGDIAGARPVLQRALRIKEQILEPNHPLLATTLTDLGHLSRDTGDSDAALRFYEKALRIRESAYGPNHPDVAQSLNNVAAALADQRKYAEARVMQERAVGIYEQRLGLTHTDLAVALGNLATILANSHDYTAAFSLAERAVRIEEKILGPEHPKLATSLNNLASLANRTGDFRSATLLYQRALGIAEAKLGPTHPLTALVLANFASSDWDAGHPEKAAPKLARAASIARMHTARGLVGLSIREKLSFLKTTDYFVDTLLSMPSTLVGETDAYGMILDGKNLLWRTLAAERTLIDAKRDVKVAKLLEDYTESRRELASFAIRTPTPSDLPQHQSRMASLINRLEAQEADLSRSSAAYRQSQIEASAGPMDVCVSVPKDAAFMELFWYVRFAPRPAPGSASQVTPHYVAFILTGGDCEKPIRVDLGPAAPIEDDVRRFREALSREAPDREARELRARYRQAVAARLKVKLFPPEVQAAIAGKSRLVISPDGTLALLPFALLPGEDGHEFLLETRTISYVPSGRDFLRAPGSPSVPTGLLALGAPAFDRAPVQVAQAGSQRAGCGTPEDPFAPLPGTMAEVRAIARVYQQTNPMRSATVLEGTQATKAALLAQASGAGVLHLATHAYFAGEDCTLAGLVSEQRNIGTEPPAFLGYNPLLLAGIALTGANERDKGDGVLTALEVTALDLRGTELVVLSACDTGLGTAARGQELLGLRWAFAYAGARNLVTSLWTVPDVETATLMTHFYTALWEKGLSVPAALRSAQLEMLTAARARGNSAPHTWGAFVASGRPN